jgi:hypothetical protein
LAHPAHSALFFLPVLNRASTAAAGLALPPRATSASPAMEPLPRALHFMPMHNFSLVGELLLYFTLQVEVVKIQILIEFKLVCKL